VFNDCRQCDRHDEACQDCVVAVIAPLNGVQHLEAEELRALRVLADAGLLSLPRLHTVPPSQPNRAQPDRRQAEPRQAERRQWAYPATRAS